MVRRVFTSTFLVAVAVVALASPAFAATISRVSEAVDGTGGSLGADLLSVSDDGRFVAFRSTAGNLVPLDTNGVNDVFVKDTQTGAIERASVSSAETQANAASGGTTVWISGDGRYVLFDSAATNLDGPTVGAGNLFVRDRQAGTTTMIPRDDGSNPLFASIQGSISGNGRYVAFIGTEHTVGVPGPAVYVADRQTGDVERLAEAGTSGSYAWARISDDGRFITFIRGLDIILFDRILDTWELANPRIGGAAAQFAAVAQL
ncbi:MAG: hypothetical protein R6W79_02005, partial [Acidimicrobiia bacterium]